MEYQLKDIQLLVDTGKIISAQALYQPLLGGWILTFNDVYPLYAQRGDTFRVFKGLDAAQNVVKKLGLPEMIVKNF